MPSNSVLERRFERLIWRFRLVSIVPVLLSLMGSVGCFLVGAREILQALDELLFHTSATAQEAALEKSVAQIVGGVDYFVIGIALLIFAYGIYELVISDIDPRHEGELEQHRNLLSVGSLESLKHNLTNVIVVALIVSAFKKMIGFPVENTLEMLTLCACVALLALSAWLIVRSHSTTQQFEHKNRIPRTRRRARPKSSPS